MRERLNTTKRQDVKSVNTIEASHFKHLTEGVSPIMVCLNENEFTNFKTLEHLFTSKSGRLKRLFKSESKLVHDVDYSASSDYLTRNNFLNGGTETYVISPVDEKDKISRGFFDCTGLVVVGIDKTTGKKISFLSHQDPKKFLFDTKDSFIKHLAERLSEIRERSIPGTIDAVIIGGNYLPNSSYRGLTFTEAYLESVKLISTEFKRVLGFEPAIVNGPKVTSYADDVFFDNENKRLYFARPRVNSDTGSFSSSDIKKEKPKWDPAP